MHLAAFLRFFAAFLRHCFELPFLGEIFAGPWLVLPGSFDFQASALACVMSFLPSSTESWFLLIKLNKVCAKSFSGLAFSIIEMKWLQEHGRA